MVANNRWSPQGRNGEDLDAVRLAAQAQSSRLDDERDLDPLMERIGGARFVLLGEASHGTSEFYTWRTRITQRLIREKGFSFIAVEGDWPDCYRVNRYVKGYDGAGSTAYEVLNAFTRWPTWMWANREVVHLAEWLRGHNEPLAPDQRVGFYGLDVYSLWDSMDAVVGYLKEADPRLVPAALRAYACFEPYGRDEHRYARASAFVPAPCEDEVVSVLASLRRRAAALPEDGEARFDAEQNALVAVNAERYYRAMIRADTESWNVRDTHMADTLDRLMTHHREQVDVPKAVVWAHNTHVGDAGATDMAAEGMTNLGQLVRERHERQGVVLVGFAAHHGTVIAADAWGDPMRRMHLPPAMPGCWEDLLLDNQSHGRLLITERIAGLPGFRTPRGHRAIGVVYRPRFERLGNYVPTVLPERYDALLYFADTRALHPLHIEHVQEGVVPETYPSGV